MENTRYMVYLGNLNETSKFLEENLLAIRSAKGFQKIKRYDTNQKIPNTKHYFSLVMIFDTPENADKFHRLLLMLGRVKPLQLATVEEELTQLDDNFVRMKMKIEAKRFHSFKDRVVLTTEQCNMIIEVIRKELDTRPTIKPFLETVQNQPLLDFSLMIDDKIYINYLVSPKKNEMIVEAFTDDKSIAFGFLYNLDEKIIKPYYKDKDVEFHEKDNMMVFGQWIWLYYALMFTIKNMPKVFNENKIKEKTTIECKDKKGYKKYKSSIQLIRQYNLNKISKTSFHKEFHCLCWSVIGHYRHYKSGKTIFINPYRKGKERNNTNALSTKEYKL